MRDAAGKSARLAQGGTRTERESASCRRAVASAPRPATLRIFALSPGSRIQIPRGPTYGVLEAFPHADWLSFPDNLVVITTFFFSGPAAFFLDLGLQGKQRRNASLGP